MNLRDIVNIKLDTQLMSMRIIVAALAMGCFTFAMVTGFICNWKFEGEMGTLTMVGFLIGASSIMMSFVVPTILQSGQTKTVAANFGPKDLDQDAPANDLVDQLVGVAQTKTIIGAAILEGGAFANLVFALLENHWASMIVAAIATGLLFRFFPFRDPLQSWIENTFDEIKRGVV